MYTNLIKSRDEAVQAIEIIRWVNDNKATYMDAQKHFGVDRRKVSTWINSIDVDVLSAEFGIDQPVKMANANIEKKLVPESVIEKAERCLENLTTLTEMSSLTLIRWVQSVIDRMNDPNGKVLSVYELDRLIKILSETAKYTLPSTDMTVKETTSLLYSETRSKLEEAKMMLMSRTNKETHIKQNK
jgi:hypothetical protein